MNQEAFQQFKENYNFNNNILSQDQQTQKYVKIQAILLTMSLNI